MLSYEFYKVLHVFTLLIMAICFGAYWSSEKPAKVVKIGLGISSFLVLVGGMGLLARIGVDHGSGFPLWVKLKMGIWFVLAIGIPVVFKRFSAVKNILSSVFTILFFVAIYLAVHKL